MRPIQFLLCAGLLCGVVVYFQSYRSSLRDRMIGMILFCGSFGAVLFPDYTQMLAELAGVGRGVDLFLYLFAVLTLFGLLVLYSKLSKTESSITELVRDLAILRAEKLSDRADDQV